MIGLPTARGLCKASSLDTKFLLMGQKTWGKRFWRGPVGWIVTFDEMLKAWKIFHESEVGTNILGS